MKHCWLDRGNGHALINDTGAVVGEIINLDKQTYARDKKLPYGPTNWFEWHVYKKQEERESA